MTDATAERLFDFRTAFDDPVVTTATVAVASVVVILGVGIELLYRLGRIDRKQCREAFVRWRSWAWPALLVLAPLLLGAAWVMGAVAVLSLLCYREYARATGLFREKAISAVVVLGIFLVTFANYDHYPRLFFAAAVLTSGLIAIVTIPQDRPRGFIQRVALGVLGFLFFGYSLGYLGMMANATRYRPLLLLVVLGAALNDVFAYGTGKALGGPKILPNTSPGKTVAGSLGALVLTTALVGWLGHVIYEDTAIDRLDLLLILGAGTSILGQLGGLLLSSVKRDLGLGDAGDTTPGHGGLLDRFASLILVPPAAYHYLSLHLGPLTADQAERILSGG
jgi:phosphatidate cytidylyltransferase